MRMALKRKALYHLQFEGLLASGELMLLCTA